MNVKRLHRRIDRLHTRLLQQSISIEKIVEQMGVAVDECADLETNRAFDIQVSELLLKEVSKSFNAISYKLTGLPDIIDDLASELEDALEDLKTFENSLKN